MQYYTPYLQWIDQQKESMLELVKSWSNINTHTFNLKGLNVQIEALKKEFSSLGGHLQELTLPPFFHIQDDGTRLSEFLGKALHIVKRPEAPLRFFFSGHMDTVHAQNSPFQRASIKNKDILQGPGACDMKGGLVILLTALRALEQSSFAANVGWEILISPDEEIGSPGSKAILERAARRNHLGFVFEPAFFDGSLVLERAGSINLTVIARGKSAHAGRDYEKGVSALFALTSILVKLESLNSKELTINAGTLLSGHSFNTVPELAIAKINIRSHSTEAIYNAQKMLDTFIEEELEKRCQGGLKPCTIEIHEHSVRMPKTNTKETEQLMSWIEECGTHLHLEFGHKSTNGVSDGNILAMHGLPTLDSLGAIGGEIHTQDEYIKISSLSERAKLVALLLMKIANHDFIPTSPHKRFHNKDT
jgi:glutamate carboxypeptidase